MLSFIINDYDKKIQEYKIKEHLFMIRLATPSDLDAVLKI